MSLRDRLTTGRTRQPAKDLHGQYGLLANPFPPSSQTAGHPHYRTPADDEIEERVLSFLRDHSSQVVVVEGTQGVGKTNLLNFWEKEIEGALADADGYYVIRYLADPEASFDGTIRRLFQELGVDHIRKLGLKLSENKVAIDVVRSPDMRVALHRLAEKRGDGEVAERFVEWLLGFRILKIHRELLNVQFRLDTVESKTSALRDLVIISSEVHLLQGIFLLLDELEKQDGVLGPTAVVRYLSAMRAIIDALPHHLFMMLAVTPDAMRRYSSALPAFRSRLQNQVTLHPLADTEEALSLARFYVENARKAAGEMQLGTTTGAADLVEDGEIARIFDDLLQNAKRRGDTGVRQRDLLHRLHERAEHVIQESTPA